MSDAASSSSGLFDLERRLHPIQLVLDDDLRRSRLTVFFRFLLAWWVALVTGRIPRGMRDLLAYWLRYQGQTTGYLLLLTDRYPSFSDRH